jgi:hypothetical protein
VVSRHQINTSGATMHKTSFRNIALVACCVLAAACEDANGSGGHGLPTDPLAGPGRSPLGVPEGGSNSPKVAPPRTLPLTIISDAAQPLPALGDPTIRARLKTELAGFNPNDPVHTLPSRLTSVRTGTVYTFRYNTGCLRESMAFAAAAFAVAVAFDALSAAIAAGQWELVPALTSTYMNASIAYAAAEDALQRCLGSSGGGWGGGGGTGGGSGASRPHATCLGGSYAAHCSSPRTL